MRNLFIVLSVVAASLISLAGISKAGFTFDFIPSFLLNEEDQNQKELTFETKNQQVFEQAFTTDNLKTNTAKRSIQIENIFGGGPAKDGIPALSNPEFINVEAADLVYEDDSSGVLVEINGDARWYSFDILYWHEVINDTLSDIPVAVTFCPLCGSAITYDRRLENGETLEFGVSGKLWQSNLLMYDQGTESLWSQIEGEAKVGDLTGETLKVINSNVITWAEAKTISDLKVQSQATGFVREYGKNPYGTYEKSSALMFPVDNEDQTLLPKTIMVAGTYNNIPFALDRLALFNASPLEIKIGTEILTASVDGGKVTVLNTQKEIIPTYNTMWFSWANHWRTDNSVVWFEGKEKEIEKIVSDSTELTLFEYFSYGCSYCKQMHNALDEAIKKVNNVNLELKHFIIYEAFLPIHEGQICATEQGQGYAFHDAYFRSFYPKSDSNTALIISQSLSLNQTDFANCLASERPQQVINSDMQEGTRLGVRGTPTMLISGPNLPLKIFSGRTEATITQELESLRN